MSTFRIDERNPETRAKVLEQISGTETGTTALATVEIKRPSQLATLERALQMLAECRSLPEVKKIRDIAEAAKVYAKAAHLGQDAQNYAAEIALFAERKAGDMFAELERAKPKPTGGRVRKSEAKSEYAITLEESKTSEREAQRWQEIAKIPEKTFNDYIQQSKALKTEISRVGLSKTAKKAAHRECPAPIVHPVKPLVSAADITARLTVLLSELSTLNTFTKQLRYADLDELSKAEVQTLIAHLRKVSKDADERANRLQEVAS
jgi:hypothetical protein